jgi:hypothetical protein
MGIMIILPKIMGNMPAKMSSSRSSIRLDSGPIMPKQKQESRPPEARITPKYRMASCFVQPKLSIARGVTSLQKELSGNVFHYGQLPSHVSISTKLQKKEKKHHTDTAIAIKSGFG